MPEGAIYAVLKQVRTITAAVTTTSSLVLDSNECRKGSLFFNDSDWSAYITFGPTASLTNASRIIGPYKHWEDTGPAVWCGEVSAIRESGTGSLVITEMI